MLKNGASFFRKEPLDFETSMKSVSANRAYAELLRDRMAALGTFSYGDHVFRGQSSDASMLDPIKPEYTNKTKTFMQVINEKVTKLFAERYASINYSVINKTLSHLRGEQEYIVAIEDRNVNIIPADSLDESVVTFIKGVGRVTINTEKDVENSLIGWANNKATRTVQITSLLIKRLNRIVAGDIKSGATINVNKYEKILLNTIKKVRY
jgi:hypothetical protein